jgi:glycosyltransferase involved in cell wall biosynthesis
MLASGALAETSPKISVIVNFFNMRREASRTLLSLTPEYQRGLQSSDYEVIAVDNGSSEPLGEQFVSTFGDHFRYLFFDSSSPSPCAAINFAVKQARYELVMICIDGARILSPGILERTRQMAQTFANPFVYTLGMHLGHTTQNELVTTGYTQSMEDELLESVDWRSDGYRLFQISSVAMSSKKGYFSELSESNCYAMSRNDFLRIGGLNERFHSLGGGLVNLDFFNRVSQDRTLTPIMLLGEATFHQFHGGVATNVAIEDHPWARFAAEYQEIYGNAFSFQYRAPMYFGSVHEFAKPVLLGEIQECTRGLNRDLDRQQINIGKRIYKRLGWVIDLARYCICCARSYLLRLRKTDHVT